MQNPIMPERQCPMGASAIPLILAFVASSLSCSNRGTVLVGGPCNSGEACVTGVCIREASNTANAAWSGGYCSGNCATAACPQGLCLPLSDGRSYCVSSCASNSTCREGYVCSAGVGACLPDCRQGWSCGAAMVCDQLTGACTLSSPPAGSTPLGSPCTINAECVTGLCIPERTDSGTVAWTGGSCSQDCASAACPTGAVCAAMEDGSAYCVPACAGTDDCRAGYTCDVEILACLPDCRLGWSCGTRFVCDASSGTCVYRWTTDAGMRDGGRPDGGLGDAGWRGAGDSGGFGPGTDDGGRGAGPGGMAAANVTPRL
jgi:hypothetical protein